jgi:predicted nucleic acid-binding protein
MGNTIVVAEIALVEVIATFSRMARETPPRLLLTQRDRVIADFEARFLRQYTIVQVDRSLLIRAATLCRTYPLRAYDAVQLACALTRRDDDLAAGALAPIFVCADANLLTIAAAAGFATKDPNSHP